ncbi:hypothetical protein BGZ67_007527 [Mortierella alpina]|nr:hypothetical protein BGZ67_007527 [Mortierella alpina]
MSDSAMQLPPIATNASPPTAGRQASRARAQLYHSDPIPPSPSQAQFLAEPQSPQQPPSPSHSFDLPRPSRSSTGTLPGSPRANTPKARMGSGNGGAISNRNSHDAIHKGALGDHASRTTPVQFNTSEIERSFQALLKKQPLATVGPSVLQGKIHRHLHPKDAKPRHFLSASSHSHQHSHHAHLTGHQHLHGTPNGNTSYSQSGSSTQSHSHSPIFGSPAADHARHWIKSVGHHVSDSENEQREGSDQDHEHDSYEDNQQQQWQIDYDHHVAGHVELETDVETERRLPDNASQLPWPGKAHPLFNMAEQRGSKEQGSGAGTQPAAPPTKPFVRIKDQHAVHPLSPAPLSPSSGTSTPRIPQSRSPEMRPQVVLHPSELAHAIDIGSIPPPDLSTVTQPLPPLPAPAQAMSDQSRVKPKHSKQVAPSKKTSRTNLLAVKPSPVSVPALVFEKRPVSLTNPPRKCIHHGKILQVINTSTVKDRYLFLFSDILLIAKPMSDGHPTIDSRFQVKDVIELKKISLSLTRDKYDPKGGEAGAVGNRKIPPILAEFIHTFDQNPTRALNTFIQKRALHPDPVSVAHLLFKTPELSKMQLASFLSNPANKHVYRAFLDQCQFAGVLLDEALRTLLGRLSLPERLAAPRVGVAERVVNSVDYLLEEFTKRWYEANVNVVVFDASIAHKLVIAMIVLNAQLHNNEGACLVRDREEVGTLVRPRVGSQPSTPTIPSTPIMDSSLADPSSLGLQQYMSMELEDLTAFPTPSKDSFVEMFQLLDQQRIVPKDTLHNIFLSICHQPLDIDMEKLHSTTTNAESAPAVARKLWPIMMSPSVLPPRLTLKIPSDPITITVPVLNPHFSIHLGGRDLKCEPSVLEFGSHRSQRFKITGSVPGKKTLTIHPRLVTDRGTPEQYYDLQNLPSKHTIAIERQFMRHTFQISLLNDLGTRRRYLFGTSSAAEKDEWACVLTECLSAAKGQNAVRLNEHTGLEQSIGLQILKELLLGVEASDEDEAPTQGSAQSEPTPVPLPLPLPLPVVPASTMGLGIPMDSAHGTPGKGPLVPGSAIAASVVNGLQSPTLGVGAAASTEWPVSSGHGGNTSAASPKDTWMCKMPKPGSVIPDRHGWELVRLVEQNSLMALMLGFMGALGRDRLRRMEAVRKSMQEEEEEAEARRAAVEEYGEQEEGRSDFDYDEYNVGEESEESEDICSRDHMEGQEEDLCHKSTIIVPIVQVLCASEPQQAEKGVRTRDHLEVEQTPLNESPRLPQDMDEDEEVVSAISGRVRMVKVITLPETVFHISRFLDRGDIKQCTQVCRFFHAAFFPILCESVSISGENGELMGISVLQMYAQHVRYLTVDGSLPQDYYSIVFKHLERLELEASSLLFTCLCPAPLAGANPSIKDLTVSYMAPGPSAEFWDAVYTKWINPRSLVLRGESIPDEVSDAFWRACSRFRRIVFYDLDIHHTSNSFKSTYEYQARSLDLNVHLHYNRTLLDPLAQLALIQACPELTSLSWTVRHHNAAMRPAFIDSIRRKPLSKVETFKFDMSTLSSDIYILLLERLPRLRNLDLPQGLFDARAFACLRSHHFGTLESLTLGALPPRPLMPALEVLTHCPKLKRFDAPYIYIEDIVRPPFLPWACTQLEFLRIHIVKQDQDREEWDFQVFSQLSRLTQLRCLDLSGRYLGLEEFQVTRDEISVNLTLAAGLGALAGCRMLEKVAITNTHQELTQKEVLWMTEQWPRLRSVQGSMSKNDERHKVLAAVLEARGVATQKCPYAPYYW